MKNEVLNSTIREMFASAQRIVIVSHIRPDGDAVGALLGLGLSLQAAGRNVQMVLVDGIPSNFHHLEGVDRVSRKIKGDVDLTVTLDCSDLARTGNALGGRIPDLNIDHHITNLNFARVNLVDPSAVATSAILAELLPHWSLPVTKPVAEALLTGIVSDSLGFRTTNTTPDSLRLAAGLMDAGANLPNLYYHALMRRSYEAAHFWGLGLSRLAREDRLIWTSLTLEDRTKSGYSGNDDADLVNMLATVDDNDVAVIFVEQKGGHVKVSWRGEPGFDVSKIALQFGGGGHAAAAGADIIGTIDIVQDKVLQATRALLANTSFTNLRNEDISVETE